MNANDYFCPPADDGALAHQIELEHRQQTEEALLKADPAYPVWLDLMDQTDRNGEMEDSEMPSYVSDTGGEGFQQCPQGTHIAVCDRIFNLGLQTSEYEGKAHTRNQHFIGFQIPAERVTWEDKDGKWVDYDDYKTLLALAEKMGEAIKESVVSLNALQRIPLEQKANLKQALTEFAQFKGEEDEV